MTVRMEWPVKLTFQNYVNTQFASAILFGREDEFFALMMLLFHTRMFPDRSVELVQVRNT